MNLKKLNSHVSDALKSIKIQVMDKDGSNAVDFFCADVVGSRQFAQNFGGYPRSEIAIINECQNAVLQESLIKQLDDFRASADAQNVGVPDAELMLAHKSKYQQTASEVQQYYYDMLTIRDSRVAVAEASKAAKKADHGAIEFDKSDNNTDV